MNERERPRQNRDVALLACALAVGTLACAAHGSVERRPDGTLRVECRNPLSTCLQRIEVEGSPCAANGYDVVYAKERREQTGSASFTAVEVKSEAIVRCRQAVPLLGADTNVPYPPPGSAPAPSAPTTPTTPTAPARSEGGAP